VVGEVVGVVGVVVGEVVGVVGVVVGEVVGLGLRVVVVARRPMVVVVATRPLETPPKMPDPPRLPAVPALTTVVVGERLGPVVDGAFEEAGATVGLGENTVPKASQPGPQRPPWAARRKATVKATRAKAENPATRTRRLACQPWVRATRTRETRSTRPAWSPPAATPNEAKDGDRLAAALTSAGPLPSAGPPRAAGIGRAARISTGG
jgi:hypothetical protein